MHVAFQAVPKSYFIKGFSYWKTPLESLDISAALELGILRCDDPIMIPAPANIRWAPRWGSMGVIPVPTTPQGPPSILLALVCVLCAKAVSWDVSLVHGSLYIFINKTIIKRGSEMLCGIQCWFLHFSTARSEPVSTLLLVSRAASRMPLLSQYLHTFLYCIVFLPCQCIFSVQLFLYLNSICLSKWQQIWYFGVLPYYSINHWKKTLTQCYFCFE